MRPGDTVFILHKRPVHEHEGQTVVGIVVVENFPCNGLLISHRPSHARNAYSGWQIGDTLENNELMSDLTALIFPMRFIIKFESLQL